MTKPPNKNAFKNFIKKINEIDVNEIITSLQKVNIEDLKKIEINQIANKLKKSPFIKPTLGIFSASLFFTFLLLPNIQKLISKFNQANQYQLESNSLELTKLELKNRLEKIKQLSMLMAEIDNSILNKENLIFVSKLINETAIKSNVEINLFAPIDIAKSGKLCKQVNSSNSSRKTSKAGSRRRKRANRKRRTSTSRKGAFETNLYEVNLTSDYLNMLEFLKVIQFYDVTVIPNCLEITALRPQVNRSNSGDDFFDNNSTIITPLSQSGAPLNSTSQGNSLSGANAYGRVRSRLVLKIPSHSR